MAITMCSTLPILSTICFAFLQIISINIATSESSTPPNNSTHHSIPWKSERSKRSLHGGIPDRLQIHMKYSTGEEIELNWIKIDQYLANKYLPVVTPSDYSGKNVMENIGDFVIYHDIAKCSAVIYFKKTHTIFGVIGLDYIISNLPYKFDNAGRYKGIVEEPFLTRRSNTPLRNDPVTLTPEEEPEESLDSSPCGGSRINKHQSVIGMSAIEKHVRRTRHVHRKLIRKMIGKMMKAVLPIMKTPHADVNPEYCLETLVFVTNDVVEFFKLLYGPDTHIEWIVKYYLLYFNAVDMIFQKMRTTQMRLRINIAKIVFEDSSTPFEFLNDGELQFSETITKLRECLQTNKNIYPSDSFDHVFVSTRRIIMDHSIDPVVGITELGEDLYLAREQDRFYNAVPITAVGFLNDYSIGVREISRAFGIETKSWTDGLELTEECNSITSEDENICDRCLKWADSSLEQFKTFFKTNQNRCFLLNEPRSIRPPGPSEFLEPSKQCQCFGFQSYISPNGRTKNYVDPDECNGSLQCSQFDGEQKSCDHTLRPYDGTACGIDKVCWNRKCVNSRQRSCARKRKLFGKFL